MVCAKAARESRKGEDYTCVLLEPHGQPPAAFAVFDGHSGKRTGKLCAEIICQRILARGPPFEPAAIVDAFWAADMEIGTTPEVRDGATAQVMLVDRMSDGALQGTFAWCGDSTAIQVDVATGRILYKTLNHMPSEPTEAARLRHYGAVRARIEAGGVDTLYDVTTAEHVRAALLELGLTPTDEEVSPTVRHSRPTAATEAPSHASAQPALALALELSLLPSLIAAAAAALPRSPRSTTSSEPFTAAPSLQGRCLTARRCAATSSYGDALSSTTGTRCGWSRRPRSARRPATTTCR